MREFTPNTNVKEVKKIRKALRADICDIAFDFCEHEPAALLCLHAHVAKKGCWTGNYLFGGDRGAVRELLFHAAENCHTVAEIIWEVKFHLEHGRWPEEKPALHGETVGDTEEGGAE